MEPDHSRLVDLVEEKTKPATRIHPSRHPNLPSATSVAVSMRCTPNRRQGQVQRVPEEVIVV